MAARVYYGHKELMNKNSSEMQEMLFKKGINWNDYPDFFKRGQYVRRIKVIEKYSKEELENLPLKHAARTNENLLVERSSIVRLKLPPLIKITNRADFIYNNAEPLVAN